MKKTFPAACVIGLLLWRAAGVEAIGIAMRFVDVTMENVQPGSSFNLRVTRNLPLIVINQDDQHDTDIVVESVVPREKEMKDEYEPMPDPSWVQAVPNRFHLGPKATASADIVITIPNDPKLIGHHYESILWVHTDQKNKALPTTGVMFQAGLRSRFRLSVGTMGPESLQREKALKKLATINTNFSVNPDNLFVNDIPLGQEIDLKAAKKASLKVVNQADETVSLKIRRVPADPNVVPQAGYEYAPDTATWLVVTPTNVKVDGNSIKEVKLRLRIPDQPEYHGKKYMFLVQTTLSDDSLPLAYNNMVYVSTLP